jgi:hypothetical protein
MSVVDYVAVFETLLAIGDAAAVPPTQCGVRPDSHFFRSRPLHNRGGFDGFGGNWVDRTAGQGTGRIAVDGYCHLAKVGVAGSNTVFRSKGQRHKSPGQNDKRGSSDFSGEPPVRRSPRMRRRRIKLLGGSRCCRGA